MFSKFFHFLNYKSSNSNDDDMVSIDENNNELSKDEINNIEVSNNVNTIDDEFDTNSRTKKKKQNEMILVAGELTKSQYQKLLHDLKN